MLTTITDKDRASFSVRGLTAIVDHAVASHARAVALLVIVALLSFLPGFSRIPPVDRDEARFAQATKQMLESGEYVDIHFQDEVRYKKPVGIYWLQVAAVKTAGVLGVHNPLSKIWVYRIPSLLGAIGAVLLTYWAAFAFVSRRAALLAGLMMASCILLGFEARLAKTDAVLLFTAVAAMGAMARVYLEPPRSMEPGVAAWKNPAIFWTAVGVGILIKGPLIVMFAALTIVALGICDRSIRWTLGLRPVAGLIWLCVLVLPWFVAIVMRSGGGFFAESVGHDLMAKLVSAQEAHGAPPGFYFALFWVTFWPGATLAAMAVPAIWTARRERGAKFLLCWIVPAWLLLEIVPTKLPHYVLPLYPALAILIAGVIDPQALSRRPWLVRGTGWWFVFPALAGVGGVVILATFQHQLGFLAWPFAAGSMVFGLWAWWLYSADGAEHALLRAVAASILLAVAIYAVIIPSMTAMFPAASLARMVRAVGCGPEPMVATAGYDEPSLIFQVGTDVKVMDGSSAADFLNGGACRIALIEARQERNFFRRADALGLRYSPPERFEGFNYSVGRAVTISAYRSEAAP